jgi:hypothetical protein
VLDYQARYTHRVAVSNERIEAVEAGGVRLRVRDNERGGTTAVRIDGVEFIRRFPGPRGVAQLQAGAALRPAGTGAQGQAVEPGARRTGIAAAQRGSVRAGAGVQPPHRSGRGGTLSALQDRALVHRGHAAQSH